MARYRRSKLSDMLNFKFLSRVVVSGTILALCVSIFSELQDFQRQSDYDKFEDDENAIASRKPLKDLNQIGYIKYLQNLVVGSEWLELSSQSKVTLFSQSSLDHLSSLVKVGEQWKGPISVAIYVPGVDFHLTKLYINYLQNCHPQLMSRMTVHFGVPLDCTPDIEAPNIPISLGDCPSNEIVVDTLVSWRAEKVIRFLNNTPYPYNTLRNLARNAVQTEYLMMIDMELIPSQNMFQGLEEFLRQNKTKDCFTCAYVIPQFEIEPSAYWELPKAKKQLITMVKSKLAEPFYGSKYKPLSHCVEGYKWLDVPDSSKVEIAFRMNYTSLCEPIVVLRSTAPGYQNEFRGFGFDRVSQIIHLYLTGYSFQVLNSPFFLHLGRKFPNGLSVKNQIELENNFSHFQNLLLRLGRAQKRDVCADLFSITLPEALVSMKHVCLQSKFDHPTNQDNPLASH